MPSEARVLLREQLDILQRMEPGRRQAIERRYSAFKALEPDEQRDLLEQYRRATPAKEAAIRRSLTDILAASPGDRRAFLDNAERWREMTPAERQRARERRRPCWRRR